MEVRGYEGGAQLGDLLRIGRFVRRFITDEGRQPDAAWYIVNHFRQRSPSTRQPALAGNDPEIAAFAEDHGSVIATTELFQLARAVEAGEMKAEEARTLLIGSTGRFSYGGTGA